MNRSPAILLVLVGVSLASPLAFGGMTFYTSRGAFDAPADVTLLDDYSAPSITLNTALSSFEGNGISHTEIADAFDGGTLNRALTYSAPDDEYLGIQSSSPGASIRWTNADGRILDTGIGNLSEGPPFPNVEKTLWLLGVSLAALGTSRSLRFRGRPSRDFWPIFMRI